ncbi:hypothetical protein FBULB1_9820 [Fusarium bulbicola]|nr:hypothetical protein FBULB1_9820 [Fusarium bulbicola]
MAVLLRLRVWVESDLLNNVAVSGVGRWGNSVDDFSGTVPVDPKKRYDDDAGPGTTIDVALTPNKPTIFMRSLDEDVSAWGYGFHASCWIIFTKGLPERMSVSFVNLPEGVFVSGLVLIDHNHERHAIGYIHESNMVDIHLPIAQYIHGWELALHTSGVKAMALIYEDGVLSSWAGEPVGTPRWRLAGPLSLSAIKAEFDAMKLVKLSREGSLDELTWLNNCLWCPQVPPTGLLYDWNEGDKPPSEFILPMTTVFFGEADGMYSSILSEIVIWIFDICYIAGIEFRFTDASHNRHLGNIGPFDQEFPGRRNFSDSNDSTILSMTPIRTPKRVRFMDQYDLQKSKASLIQTSKPGGTTIFTKKDEECRFITGALSRFLKPLEIPPNTHLIEHCPWSEEGIYTIRSIEPILPNTKYNITVRVTIHQDMGWVEVIFSMAGGLFDWISLPPVQWAEVPNMELALNNGMKVCVKIEDSIHGRLLASYLKKLGLFELQAKATTDLGMESPQ